MGAATALRQLIGGLLLTVGVLITLTGGLCTGILGVHLVGQVFQGHLDAGTVPFLAIAAVATLVGVGLTWAGVETMRD